MSGWYLRNDIKNYAQDNDAFQQKQAGYASKLSAIFCVFLEFSRVFHRFLCDKRMIPFLFQFTNRFKDISWRFFEVPSFFSVCRSFLGLSLNSN